MQRAAESVVVGAMGGALAWVLLDAAGFETIRDVGAVAAALNGLISGAVGLYSWHKPKGWLFFILDSTWGLVGTALGLLIHAWNRLRGGAGYTLDMCRRTNRHVYEGGFGVRAEFAFAQGNVISNAGGSVGLRGESERSLNRRKFVVAHEGLHVMQSRLFGPLFQIGYVVWMIGGAVVGLGVALARDRRQIGKIVETFAYYNNPFEYWAYRNDDYWPPAGAVAKYAWGPVEKP